MSRLKKMLGLLAIVPLVGVAIIGCGPEVLALDISSPENGAQLTEGTVAVNGTVSNPEAIVTVNGTAVEVAPDGTFSTTVQLAYGANNITVTATLEGAEPATEVITVTRVLAVEIISPEDGAELTESPATINGTVSDANATVTVNGTAVEVASDGTFSAPVDLTEGENVIEVVAALGELEASDSITVTYTPTP